MVIVRMVNDVKPDALSNNELLEAKAKLTENLNNAIEKYGKQHSR